jgi:hypothetical protein
MIRWMRAIRVLQLHWLLVIGVPVFGGAAGICAPAYAAQYYRGYAYTADDHALLYTESHWLYEEQGSGHRLVIYSCPNGEPFARKFVDTAPGASTPDVNMLDGRTGYREGVRTAEGHREVFQQISEAAAEKHSPITTPPNAVIDAGFDAFVREHWDALSSPGVSPLPFLIPSELKYIDFSARKLRDEQAGERAVRWFRLQLDGWYAFVLPHIDVAYDASTRDLYEYRGLSNIRGKGNRNLTVTIQFPPQERRSDVAMPEVQKAAAMALSGRCASS